MNLEGKVSIVTGGGRGIGRAIAISLASAGSSVALVARTESELADTASFIEAAGGSARYWTADVADSAQVEQLISEIEEQMGPVSLLVNNAGRNGGMGPLWLTDPDDWWQVIEVNLRGPYLLARAVLPRMAARRSGRIINVASNVGTRPMPNSTAYACSKAALLRLSDSLAESVQGLGIQVFAISPGWVWTEMTRHVVDQIRRNVPDFEGIPESEISPPELAGQLVVRLAKGEADALSGRYIHVSDDLDSLLADARRITEEDLLALRLREWQRDSAA